MVFLASILNEQLQVVISGFQNFDGLTLKCPGHNGHGAYVAINDLKGQRVAFFKFSEDKVNFYDSNKPSPSQMKVIREQVSPWFEKVENFNKAAKAWNATGLAPTVPLKATVKEEDKNK